MNDGDTSHDGSLDIEEFTRLVTKVCGTVYLMSLSVSASNFECRGRCRVCSRLRLLAFALLFSDFCISPSFHAPVLVLCQSALDSGDELLPRMRAVLESVMSQVHLCGLPFCASV